MAALTLSPRAAVDGATPTPNVIPNGVMMNDYSATGAGPFGMTSTLIDSAQNEILGLTTGTAITSDVNGTIHDYLRGLVKLMAAGLPPLGTAIPGSSVPVTMQPPLLGAYRISLTSGTIGAGLSAASPIWSLRYGGTGVALVKKVTISAGDLAAFTAGPATFSLFPARSYTVNASGGTAATLTGNNGKLRTSYATSNISDLRISSTAALTPGTWTLDAQPYRSLTSSETATAGQPVLAPFTLFHRDSPDETPIILAQNEGLVIQATVPATGTWSFSVDVYWDEVANF